MPTILIVLAMALVAFGQTIPNRIPPEQAAKHLLKRVPARYPQLAEAGRIQGNVILDVSIDVSGSTSVRRLVIGHPLLAPAAIDSVKQWRYQTFEVNGKPSPVETFVVVTFGDPGRENDAATHAEILLQDSFWAADDSARAALAQADYARAEQQLNKARDILAPVSEDRRHDYERWEWFTLMGNLALAQKKNDEAEQYYKKALELRQKEDKDAPEMASSLADLGRLYAEEKRYDLARDHANRSIAIYQKNLKRVGSSLPGAREIYGQAVAYQSWTLSKIALERSDGIEAGKQCRRVLDFQTFLGSADHDSFVSSCEQVVNSPRP